MATRDAPEPTAAGTQHNKQMTDPEETVGASAVADGGNSSSTPSQRLPLLLQAGAVLQQAEATHDGHDGADGATTSSETNTATAATTTTSTSSASTAPAYQTMDPLLFSTFCASLRHAVTVQVGARLESVSSQYGPSARDELLSEASATFPFLADTDWDAERTKRREEAVASTVAATATSTARKSGGVSANKKAAKATGKAKGAAGASTSKKSSTSTSKKSKKSSATKSKSKSKKRKVAATSTKKRRKKKKRTTPAESAAAAAAAAEEEKKSKDAAAQNRAARAARRSLGAADHAPPLTDGVGGEGASSEAAQSAAAATAASASATTRKKKRSLLKPKADDSDDSDYDPIAEGRKKYKATHATFEQRFAQCQAFKLAKGHLNISPVVSFGCTGSSRGLGGWAETMKKQYRKVLDGGLVYNLTLDRLEELEEIGFGFEDAEDDDRKPAASASAASVSCSQSNDAPQAERPSSIWDLRLEKCRAYRAEHGHLNIKKSHTALWPWAERMRSLHRQERQGEPELLDSQKEKLRDLESLGFEFDSNVRTGGGERSESYFETGLEMFKAFKERTGHCRVPLESKTDPDQTLARWVKYTRINYAKLKKGERSNYLLNYLTTERMQRLTEAGFVFEGAPPCVPWEVRFEELRKYREEHGRDPTKRNAALGEWVATQRKNYRKKMDGKKSPMTDERIQKLEEIGFVFQAGPRPSAEELAARKAVKPRSWNELFDDFVKWKEAHGHPYVPTVTDTGDKRLGRWVAQQRQLYRYMKEGKERGHFGKSMSAERALKLTNAGFAWDASHIHKTPKDVIKPESADDACNPSEGGVMQQSDSLEANQDDIMIEQQDDVEDAEQEVESFYDPVSFAYC